MRVSTPRLTVIIPTLNEAANLPSLMTDLAAQQGVELEIIVGDGGSADATCMIAHRRGATVVRAPRGRGAQMNHAAAHAQGTYLLFLHADSRLYDPYLLKSAVAALEAARQSNSSGAVAGHFALCFTRTRPNIAENQSENIYSSRVDLSISELEMCQNVG